MDYSKLKKEIAYKWKIQSFNSDKTKGSCVAYIDARDVMDLLDEVVGPDKWQDKYEFVGTKLIAGIGIKGVNKDDEWVWKFDTGVESQSEADKGQFSDAFKRAAVKWGIGRFLYNLEIKWVNIIDQKYPADVNGKRIYNLTEYIEKGVNVSNIKPQNTPKTVDSSSDDQVCPIHKILIPKRLSKSTGREYWLCNGDPKKTHFLDHPNKVNEDFDAHFDIPREEDSKLEEPPF